MLLRLQIFNVNIIIFFHSQSTTRGATISGKSSSSGSYSIGGSNPNVTEEARVKISTENPKELPEKIEPKKEVKKEDKITSPMHGKEQLVPKIMVNAFYLTAPETQSNYKVHSLYYVLFFRVLCQMTKEVCIIHLQATMKVQLKMMMMEV